MARTALCALTCAIACAALLDPAVAAAQAPLKLVTTDTLKVSAKTGEDEAKSTIFVLNEGAEAATVGVTLVAPAGGMVTADASASVPAGTVASVEVTFAGLGSLEKKVVGALSITGGSVALARPVEITPAIDPAFDWPWVILLVAFGMALFLAVISIVWVIADANAKRLFAAAPGPKWSLDSWATTLTAAGAVLGTVLGALTFPDVPEQVSKDTLVSLNVFFGLLLVAGPFLLKALRRPNASPLDQESGLWGTNITLLLATCVIFAAVVGEIAVLGLLFWEILGSGSEWLAVASVAVAELLAVFYFVTTIPRVVTTNWEEVAAKAKASETKADRERMKEFARILRRELGPYLATDGELLDTVSEASDDLVGASVVRPSVTTQPRLSLP